LSSYFENGKLRIDEVTHIWMRKKRRKKDKRIMMMGKKE